MSKTEELLRRFRTDFNFYAPRALKITEKSGRMVPLELNRAQQYIHEQIEDQRRRIGKVRKIIVKGRQQGASTYVGGRFYWLASGRKGFKVQILTHEAKATKNLFTMTKRFHDNCPEVLRPTTGNDSAAELVFPALDTRYAVATAGAKGTGRSGTAQLFHGSEVAFWPNADTHMAGIGQAVPDEPGTEIILESTGNGIGNLFYGMAQDAMAGLGDYELIFVPWFWQPEYRRPVPPNFKITDEARQYQALYGLSDEQMAWRAFKIAGDFRGDEALFNQEYPAEPAMAFMASSGESLIQLPLVTAAQKNVIEESFGAIVIGCDPAEYGKDDTAIVIRQGRKVLHIERRRKIGQMQIAGILAKIINDTRAAATCVDVTGGYGRAVCDRLVELGYSGIYPVHFGESAEDDKLYLKRRSEIWGRMRDWFEDGGTCLPKDDRLASDLTSLRYDYDSSRRLRLESKEAARTRGVASPDSADALALTFAVSPTGLAVGGAVSQSFEPGMRGSGSAIVHESFEPR